MRYIKNFIIYIGICMIIALSLFIIIGNYYINNKSTPAFKTDESEIKIRTVLNVTKLQILEIEFEKEITDTRYDKSKYLDGLSKLLTSKQLKMAGRYKAIFTYDMSKAKFEKVNNNYEIILNETDVEMQLITLENSISKEVLSIIGRYYSSKDTIAIAEELRELAMKDMLGRIPYDDLYYNTEVMLKDLFIKVGLDTNQITIKRGN